MPSEKHLTNETLKNRYPSQFELVGYAITLADNMVRSGRGPRVKTSNENPAVIVLHEIEENKDILDAIQEEKVPSEEAASVYSTAHPQDEVKEEAKPVEKKVKARRIVH